MVATAAGASAVAVGVAAADGATVPSLTAGTAEEDLVAGAATQLPVSPSASASGGTACTSLAVATCAWRRNFLGDENDPSKQHTGINFEKYDDIPVEATGAGVPEPVNAFTNPPLDPVLLENIGYARYTTPTPVQKYSIPIVAVGRDLMACAQVR